MLSIDEYEFIKLLYDKFLKTNGYIKTLVQNNEWESVSESLKDKDVLIKQIMSFEKVHLEAIKENDELLKMRKNLIELEKENIELVKKMHEELEKELKQVNSSQKIMSKYEPANTEALSTFEVADLEED